MRKNILFFWLRQNPKKKEESLSENKFKDNLMNIIKNKKSKESRTNYTKRLYSKIKESLSKNNSENKLNERYLIIEMIIGY